MEREFHDFFLILHTMSINYWQSLKHDCYFHIYNRAVSGSVLFEEDSDYNFFLKQYNKYCEQYFETLAYCLIPNHFHFIVKVRPKGLIDSIIEQESFVIAERYLKREIDVNDYLMNQLRRLFSSYSITFNNKYGRRGPLLMNKVKRVAIDNDDRLRYMIAYVHHNPIHHRLTDGYESWGYSSFRYINSNEVSLLERKEVMKLYGGKEEFKEYHNAFKLEKTEEP